MKNPWKKQSKINPQRETGNRQIANDVYQALISGNFLGAEYKLIFAIISKTWGFNKSSDAISNKQFQELTNLKKRTIQSTLKKLKLKRVIYYTPSKVRAQTGSPLNSFLFNKHYDTWNVEGCNIMQGCNLKHPLESDKGVKEGKIRVQPETPTKETITKETITKEIRDFLPEEVSADLWKEFKKHRAKAKPPFTPYAEELMAKKLAKYKEEGYDPIDLINKTIEKGWKDINPQWLYKNNGGRKNESGRGKAEGFSGKRYTGSDLDNLSWNQEDGEDVS